eukprot:COSAG05_NODE_3471_length_2039_cov_12.665108_1_plen_62_part_01
MIITGYGFHGRPRRLPLLCGPEKVLFGTELLAFVGIDLTDMAGSRYGSLQFLLDQFAAWQND